MEKEKRGSRVAPCSGNTAKLYLLLHRGRSEPAGYWLRPVGSESGWSSPLLCQHPLLCPTGPPGRAGDRNTDRPSDRITTRQMKRCLKSLQKNSQCSVSLVVFALQLFEIEIWSSVKKQTNLCLDKSEIIWREL